MKYGYSKTVNRSVEDLEKGVRASLQEVGFGVLTEINVQKAMKEKLGKSFRKYKILGACNPSIAFQALSEETEIGLLLPCNVVVWENDDKTATVAAIDAKVMLTVTGRDDMEEMANQINKLLQKAIDSA
ncbi:MAG: DUF302 domain-containing protein [Candidatus Marinimicrobia bacterium]|jgi:uncharacterized protein (DUF302 family)|nr:DUF302 domain-containing protein [Candidatus Neomarinimicrobiota bacterium]MBT3496284.1 DUF302 domain-containing protein [Candidatus Neomarinimicrobiota bacterium]MBT3691621.1 DUF302 domain-containing protein [Candidatus Neomarinimicrobiota bacterium]MBT3732347.1 DUF302 domain-containing protein [Candidatus Neomarinimicrobiota bacterium]MBT4144923.1 DUF302 domain-containing protein [Candidatus Neomarinimicrobiota bacterium]